MFERKSMRDAPDFGMERRLRRMGRAQDAAVPASLGMERDGPPPIGNSRADRDPEGAPEAMMKDPVVSSPTGITSTRAPRPPRPPARRASRGISEADQLNEREMTRILNERPQGGARQDGMKKGGMVKKMAAGGMVKGMASGGKVRGCGIASKGKTRGKIY